MLLCHGITTLHFIIIKMKQITQSFIFEIFVFCANILLSLWELTKEKNRYVLQGTRCSKLVCIERNCNPLFARVTSLGIGTEHLNTVFCFLGINFDITNARNHENINCVTDYFKKISWRILHLAIKTLKSMSPRTEPWVSP